MRTLFINRFYHPDQAATSRMLTDLAKGLAVQGSEITVLTGRMWYLGGESVLPAQEVCEDVRVHRVWSTRFGRRADVGRMIDYLSFYGAIFWTAMRAKGIDCLVVLSDPPMLSVLAVVLGRLKGWKTMCWLQDIFPEIAVQAGVLRDGKRARCLGGLAHWSLRKLDAVISVGRCMEERLLALGVSRDRLFLIPNWADGQNLYPVSHQENWFRRRHDLEQRIVVMYSGNFGVVHEMDSLIALVRRLRQDSEVCVMFVGDGHGKGRLEDVVRREQLANVRFLSYQEKDDLRYSLSAGDIHLVTLRTEMEGLSVPSKVYGIMAVGRPVVFIGPERSEVAALIREAGCGEVFPPAEQEKAAVAILDLAHDHRRREYLGSAARRYFETHLDKHLAVRSFQIALNAPTKGPQERA